MTKADAKKAALEHRRRLLSCSTDLMAEIDALIADENTKDLVELPEDRSPKPRWAQGPGRVLVAPPTTRTQWMTSPPSLHPLNRFLVPLSR